MTKPFFSLLRMACLLIAAANAHADKCIGFIPSGGGDSFWRGVHSGAAEAGKVLGYEVYFRGPHEENLAAIQSTVLEMVKQRGCKAVVISPGSSDIGREVREMAKNGIPVIYVDRSLGEQAAAGSVGTDNYKAGQLAGEAMARNLNGKGAVLLMRMRRGWQTTDQRENGFVEAATRKGLQVIEGGHVGGVFGEAYARASAAMASHKGQFQGVFAPNEVSSMGVLSALREQRIAGQVAYIGFDVTDQLLDGLQNGTVAGLIVQAAHAIGYQAVEMAVAALNNRLPARRRVMVNAFYLTKNNMDSYVP
ncbi:substrate-binding domain-containing protein [Pseudoduganella sp. FT25W]|uniref:Substrate-binding domain-containing protein n=1 Tax=Duganella alba TaxID=2666081 RepID=A0A6L5QA59_9BURK|nr:substrate-binding domain-containing protein [Duganella alba]MRX06587.1 substrate-binding domain-containing protein [Duganella alba]MRX18063.1 substrate-binding domain-containing protein [Duganella alba]